MRKRTTVALAAVAATLPPAFSIFSFADLDTGNPFMEIFFLSSPAPSIFTDPIFALENSAPSIFSSMPTFTPRIFSEMLLFRYPRNFGRRIKRSRSAGRMRWPLRDFCPLVPRPEVVPLFPPLPMRFSRRFFCFEFLNNSIIVVLFCP